MRRRSGFVLVRKTGFRSGYSLASIYPSYRKGVRRQGSRGDWVAPIRLDLHLLGRTFDVPVHPGLVRFPSWVARKVRRLDHNGQVPRPPMTLDQAAAIVGGHGWQRKGTNRAHYFFAGTRVACGNWVDLTSAEFDDALPASETVCRSCANELRTAQAMTTTATRNRP